LPVRQPLQLPEFRGRTVAEASAAGEAAGANLVIFDARWNRPVKPDWVVCTSEEPVRGDDLPSGDFDIAAVPAGDPCP
jgi:acyl dehydratase